MTMGDMIRSMTDEELAETMYFAIPDICKNCTVPVKDDMVSCLLGWLKSELEPEPVREEEA